MSRMALKSRHGLTSSAALAFALLASSAAAQTPGVDVFICSPTSMTFTLNFTAVCPGNIFERPGIADTDCFYELPGNTTERLPIVSVISIQIIEVNLDLTPAHVENFVGDYQDGDSIEWTSVSATDIVNPSQIPGGIQFVIRAVDENGVTIKNSGIIDYSNDGSVSPIFEIGDQIGWIVITEFSPARPEYCPAVTSPPTTVAPVSPPTDAPVAPPSGAPVAPSSTAPLAPPSGVPVAPSSTAPLIPPSEAPVAPSSTPPMSMAPVVPPSDAPAVPTPVISPSNAPVAPMSMTPVAPPSDAPAAPTQVATPVPVAPVEQETPFPSDMSMSFDYSWVERKRGKKDSKKDEIKGGMNGKMGGKKEDGMHTKPSSKGSQGKSSDGKKKNEREGAKEKEDDDDGDSSRALRRISGFFAAR